MLGSEQKTHLDKLEVNVQSILQTAKDNLQPTLRKIYSVSKSQNEKLDHLQDTHILRQAEIKQHIQDQVDSLKTEMQHNGSEIIRSIGNQLAMVTKMSSQQFKSIEMLLLQLQQSMAVAACHNGTEFPNVTKSEISTLHETNSLFDKDKQIDIDIEESTRAEMLESICRLSRLAAEKKRTSFSQEAQDVIEDIEKLFGLGDTRLRPPAQMLGKRKRKPEESNTQDILWIDGVRRTQSLLRACSSVALNQSSK